MTNTNTNTNDPGEAAVPAGFRLGPGWRLMPTRYEKAGPGGKMQTFVMRGAHIKELVDIGALVPIEPPVAEPAQPVCDPRCGTKDEAFVGLRSIATGPLVFCSQACANARRPLNPPPVPPGPVPPEGEPAACMCGHSRQSHTNAFGVVRDCGIELDDDFCACGQYRPDAPAAEPAKAPLSDRMGALGWTAEAFEVRALEVTLATAIQAVNDAMKILSGVPK